MNKNIAEQINEIKKYIDQAELQNGILPDVSNRIQEILYIGEQKGFDHEDVKRLALGLGLFMSHDYEFTESNMGNRILNVINLISS